MKKIWKNRYQIVEETGTGGNGKVYKVWDLHLEKEWAMKILEEKVHFFREQDSEEQMDELTALKRISHPNFPRIVDAFEEEGRNILIMDYIRGVTLEEVIGKGPMRESEMVLILLQICDAILYLHQNTPKLLYLDLKPSNIMIGENKDIKLVDMGSVSIKGKRGKISGSFGYASPEQVRVQREGTMLNEQSDIFSFGMVLYAMATGSSTKLPVIEAGRRHGIFIRRENPFLSVHLERILEKCTRGNCNRRYSSMREVKKDLENWAAFLKRKRKISFSYPIFRGNNRRQWYQEKSIFCTEGKHSFYIAKKIMILLVVIFCLLPEKAIQAGEKIETVSYEEREKLEAVSYEEGEKLEAISYEEGEKLEAVSYEEGERIGQEKKSEKNVHKKVTDKRKREEILQGEKNGNQEYQKFKVVIRDHKFRKVLVKEGCAYETNSNILLEIPWDNVEGENCRIMVECEDGSQEKKRFYIECIYAK